MGEICSPGAKKVYTDTIAMSKPVRQLFAALLVVTLDMDWNLGGARGLMSHVTAKPTPAALNAATIGAASTEHQAPSQYILPLSPIPPLPDKLSSK